MPLELDPSLSGGLFEDLMQTCGDDCLLIRPQHEYRDEKPLVARAVDACRCDRWLTVSVFMLRPNEEAIVAAAA